MIKHIEIADSLYEHQRRFVGIDSKDESLQIAGLFTGYGGGKTYVGARKAFEIAANNYPIPFLCVEPTYGMIKDIMVPAFVGFLEKHGISYRYIKNEKDFHVHDRRTGIRAFIQLRSGDNPDSLKGNNVCGAWIDEPFMQDEGVYKQVTARIRETRTGKFGLYLTGTPEGMNWGAEVFQETCSLVDTDLCVIGDHTVEMHTYSNEDGSIRYIETSSEMNQSLRDDYIDSIMDTHTQEEIQSYVYGKFGVMTQGRCYYNYDANVHSVTPFELDFTRPWDISVDFNVGDKPMSWNVSQDLNNMILVRFALQRKNTNTTAMCAYLWEVLEKYATPPGKTKRHTIPTLVFYGDYSGNSRNSTSDYTDFQLIRQFFTGKAIVVVKTKPNPKVRNRVNIVNAKMMNAKGDIRMYLHPADTKPLQKDFEQVVWDKTGTKEDQSNDMLSHSSSAIGYKIAYDHPIQKVRSVVT